jgi:hypothetical protein
MADEQDEFQSLVNELIANPERVSDAERYSDDVVLAYQKKINPYSFVPPSKDRPRTAAISCTNLRQEYSDRFSMTAVIGFVFRMLKEWEPSAEDRSWRTDTASPPAPWSAEFLDEKTAAVHAITALARGASAEAARLRAQAQERDRTLTQLKITSDDMSAIKAEEAAVMELHRQAEEKDAAAHGYQYAAMIEIQRFGDESRTRVPEFVKKASRFAEVKEVIDRDTRIRDARIEMPASNARDLVGKFLRGIFDYNPDAHVRGAHSEFVLNEEGVNMEPITIETLRQVPQVDKEHDEVISHLKACPRAYNAVMHLLMNETSADAASVVLSEPDKFRRYLFPQGQDSPIRAAVEVIPSADIIHRLDYYTQVNHAALRVATETIYGVRPDLDQAFIIYDVFEGDNCDEQFSKFYGAHAEDFMTSVVSVELNKWVILGAFEQNRKRIQFYNRNTAVLEQILERHARDKELGAELMKKRMTNAKADNIRRDGPDAKGLEAYKNAGATLGSQGAQKALSTREMRNLARARGNTRDAKKYEAYQAAAEKIRILTEKAKLGALSAEDKKDLERAGDELARCEEMLKVPDGAIQVDVFTHDTEKGTMEKNHFYTEATGPPSRGPVDFNPAAQELLLQQQKLQQLQDGRAPPAKPARQSRLLDDD